MAGLRTTTPGMLKAAEAFSNTKSVASNGVQTVSGELGVLRSNWGGEAGSMYCDKSMQAWIDDCQLITNKLQEMTDLMHEGSKVIAQGEEANLSLAKVPMGPGLNGL